MIEKARDLIAPVFAPVLGRDPSLRLIDTIFSIERVIKIISLRCLLQRRLMPGDLPGMRSPL